MSAKSVISLLNADISSQGRNEGTSSVAFEVLNQLPNIFNKFVHLQLFNIKHKFVHKLVLRQILFSEKHILRKQKRTAVYGRASLVSDFKLTRENDDLLYSRHN